MITIVTYHTCRDTGGPRAVLENGPFKSENNDRQWLGQGYYFWYGNLELAEEWGKHSVARGDCSYAIMKVTLRLKKEHFFDLVGEPEHIELFEAYSRIYLKALEEKDIPASDRLVRVRELIDFLKLQPGSVGFNFRAVKVATRRTRDFTRFTSKGTEEIGINRRQQICVFPQFSCVIFRLSLLKPDNWKNRCRRKSIWINLKIALRHFITY